jgi:glycosyltransferase involved in cell wall biosynthesis
MFPKAPIYTSVYDTDNFLLKRRFKGKNIKTSFIQQIPFWKSLYRILLPLYPLAFESFDLSGYDVVISQTTRFAKGVITKPKTLHICYCHTPPRFLWDFSGGKIRGFSQLLFSFLRIYDNISAKRVDIWIAGSINAERRIKKIYGFEAKVIYPFVDLERFKRAKVFDGGFLLVISRLNNYKRVDIAIEAANRLNVPLKIVGIGPAYKRLKLMAGKNIEFLGNLDEEILTKLIAGCKALIISCEEDFGLMPLEAEALGKPVIAFKKGGALETVINDKTGYFFDNQTPEGIMEALVKLDKRGYNKKSCRDNARHFSKDKFKEEFLKIVNPEI